jgi:hypothetical protein
MPSSSRFCTRRAPAYNMRPWVSVDRHMGDCQPISEAVYMRNRRALAGSIRSGDERASGGTCQSVPPPSLRFCVRLRTICALGYPLTANWGAFSQFQRSSVGAIDAPCWPLSGSAIKKKSVKGFFVPFLGAGSDLLPRAYRAPLQTEPYKFGLALI